MNGAHAMPAQHQAAGLVLIFRVIDDGLPVREHGAHVVDRDAALKHALQGVFAEDQFIGHVEIIGEPIVLWAIQTILSSGIGSASLRIGRSSV
jgi:hypothetical protein